MKLHLNKIYILNFEDKVTVIRTEQADEAAGICSQCDLWTASNNVCLVKLRHIAKLPIERVTKACIDILNDNTIVPKVTKL